MLVVLVDILEILSTEVDCLVADCLVLIQMLNQGNNELARHKKFEVSLLVDVALGRTPAKNRVARWSPVHARLGIDRQQLVLVKSDERVSDDVSLRSERSFREGELLELPFDKFHEDGGY